MDLAVVRYSSVDRLAYINSSAELWIANRRSRPIHVIAGRSMACSYAFLFVLLTFFSPVALSRAEGMA